MNVLIIFSALWSVILADIGCPPIKPGSFGICAFMCTCDAGSGLVQASGCADNQICCPTACGGTTCVNNNITTEGEKGDVEEESKEEEDGKAEEKEAEFEQRTECPQGHPSVNCLVNPCQFVTCDSHPTAICIFDYCGGCHANFFVDENHVQC